MYAREDAGASPRAITIAWEAPASCPDRDAFVAELARLYGPVTTRDDGDPVQVRLSEHDGGFALALVTGGATIERRELVGDDCTLLVRAAALVVAVTLGPVDTAMRLGDLEAPRASPTIPVPSEDAAPDIVARVVPPDRDASPRVTPRRRAAAFVAGVAGGLALGLTPGASGAIAGELGVAFGRLRAVVIGTHAFARRDRLAAGVAVRAQTSAAGIHVLWTVHDRGIAIDLGGGVEAGATTGGGEGADVRARRVVAPWAAIVLRAGLAWPPTGRLAVGVRAEAAVSLQRATIGLRDDEGLRQVFGVAPVALRVLAGPMIRLP